VLATCEASDWFWWFGDHHAADAVAPFDRLFRAALTRVYALLGLVPPDALMRPVSRGSASARHEGAILRST
jgi:alpha-amylase/alpha-mannosidase (GH57 family)